MGGWIHHLDAWETSRHEPKQPGLPHEGGDSEAGKGPQCCPPFRTSVCLPLAHTLQVAQNASYNLALR
jgi:hypothetical protein